MPNDKKPKPNPTKGAAPARDPRGRKKEKGQISVRIEQSTLDMAYALANFWGENITDVLEIAIREAVERRLHEPKETRLARFLLLHATYEEQRIIADALVYLRLPGHVFFENGMWRTMWLGMLEKIRELPEYEETLRSFFGGPLPALMESDDAVESFREVAQAMAWLGRVVGLIKETHASWRKLFYDLKGPKKDDLGTVNESASGFVKDSTRFREQVNSWFLRGIPSDKSIENTGEQVNNL
jgi:hypothetical protein